MHRVEGGVLHQVPEWQGLLQAAADCELDVAAQVGIPETGQESPDVILHSRPRSDQRIGLGEILGFQALAPPRATTALQPSPLGTQDVHQRVPYRTVAARYGVREVLGRQLHGDAQQVPGGPVMKVEEASEVVDAHLLSPVRKGLPKGPARLGQAPAERPRRWSSSSRRVAPTGSWAPVVRTTIPPRSPDRISTIRSTLTTAPRWTRRNRRGSRRISSVEILPRTR